MNLRLIIISIILFSGATLSAQEYKKFKVGLGAGYVGTDNTNGLALYFEPAFRVEDHVSVGLRIELAGRASGIQETDFEVGFHSSYTLNGQYYLSNGEFRPLVGLGMGVYQTVSFASDDTNLVDDTDITPELGIYPRIGFDYGPMNIIIDYNFLPVAEGADSTDPKNPVKRIKNSYLAFKVGVSIGGGKR